MIVISPHLDDAVLSCGQLLARSPGSVVLTVFAGVPRNAHQRAEWDVRCGLGEAGVAISRRRDEDLHALRLLHAEPVWLDFCDAQYGEPADTHHIAAELRLLFASLGVQRVLYPLGLFHEDHLQAHAATRLALQGLQHIHGWAYEDVPYRGKAGVVDQRIAQLAQAGLRARRTHAMCEPQARALKLQALEHYASQLREIGPGAHHDAQAPERLWKLETDEANDAS